MKKVLFLSMALVTVIGVNAQNGSNGQVQDNFGKKSKVYVFGQDKTYYADEINVESTTDGTRIHIRDPSEVIITNGFNNSPIYSGQGGPGGPLEWPEVIPGKLINAESNAGTNGWDIDCAGPGSCAIRWGRKVLFW